MGDIVWKALRGQICAMGFTAYEGEMGLWNSKATAVAKPANGELEDLMNAAG